MAETAVPVLPTHFPGNLSLDALFTLPAEERGRLFAFVMESLFDGVTVCDAEGRVFYLNAAMERLCGWERTEVHGKRIWEAFHDAKEWHQHRHLLQERALGKSQIFEFEAVRKDGQRRVWRVRACPFVTPAGRFFGTVAVCGDISEEARLLRENTCLREQAQTEGSIVGSSPPLRRVMEQVRVVAPTDATVLILGESGTGKELIARAIHEGSRRREGSLVRVNCAAIPRELFESEFFGHARGAFTGAIRDRVGRFEAADGGTLFLDEVGEIPLDLQSQLLRVLQEGTFERVGEEKTRRANVRVIAATNQDLLAQCRAGRFRTDLFYRLSVFPIDSPTLRERAEDVSALASFFLARSARKLNVRPVPPLSGEQAQKLSAYPWPGNVRELENAVERALILADTRGGRLEFDLPLLGTLENTARSPAPAADKSDGDLAKSLEYRALLEALRTTRWRIHGPEGAAALLKVNAFTFTYRLKRLGLQRQGEAHQAFLRGE